MTLTGSFLVLWRIQKKLALVLMIAVPVIVVFVAMRRRSMMKVSRDVKRRTAGINAEIESSISGIRVAKAFGNEDEEIDKFTHCTNQYVSAKQGYYKVMADFSSKEERGGLVFVLFMTFILKVYLSTAWKRQNRAVD